MMGIPISWSPAVADRQAVAANVRRPELAPGAAAWGRNDAGQVRRLYYVCPCGCGLTGQVSVTLGPPANGCWHWNADEARPTLEPSIRQDVTPTRPCGWHGNLIDGEWRRA